MIIVAVINDKWDGVDLWNNNLSGHHCNKLKTREMKYNCFNCKRIPVNTLNEALKQATVTLQNTTKKDIVHFQEKKIKIHSIRKAYIWKRTGGERIYTMIKCPVALQNKVCWEASSFKMFKKVLQTAVNKDQTFDVPLDFFIIIKRQ